MEGIAGSKTGGVVALLTSSRTRAKRFSVVLVASVLSISGVALVAAGSASASSSPAAAAKAFVAAREAKVAKVDIAAMLPAKPAKGKKIVFIGTSTTADVVYYDAAKAAAKYLGWTVKQIECDPTPAAFGQAMSLAISEKPSGIISSVGLPVQTIPTQYAQLKAKKIAYVTTGTTDTDVKGLLTEVLGQGYYTEAGQWLAQWTEADSGGNANVAVFNLATYPVLNDVANGFQSTLMKICSSCQVVQQPVDATTIGSTLPGTIVSYLQAHPTVNYVVATYGDMTLGLSTALASAGLASRVKVITQTGDQANLANLVNGTEFADVENDSAEAGWLMIDALARMFAKVPVAQQADNLGQALIVIKANVGNPNVAAYPVFTTSPGYQSQFLKLWHVS